MPSHADIPAADVHVIGYRQNGDPGAIGAGKVWIDTNGGAGNWLFKVRDAANTGWETVGGGGGAHGLGSHTDVDLTGLAAGDIIVYDGADWIPDQVPPIPSDLDDLADVDLTGASTGDVLTKDAGGDWVAAAPAAGGSSDADASPIDVPPSAPSAYDDEFTGVALDAKWTKNPIVTANAIAVTVSSGRLIIAPNNYAATARTYGIAQVETGGGSFKIWAKMSSPKGGTDAYNGLFVGVTGGVSQVFGIGPNASAALAQMGTTAYNEGGSDWGAYDGSNNAAGNPTGFASTMPMWYRMRWDAGATTLYYDYSTDGDQWLNWSSRSFAQPNRIGLVLYAQSNPAGWAAQMRLNVRYFRYEANATF